MRPISITFLCVILFLIGGLQFLGSLGGIMIGNGFGPEKIFKGTSEYEVPMEYLIDGNPEVPVVTKPENQADQVIEIPEHIIPAAKYGLFISFFLIVSVIMLWNMKKNGVYMFAAVSAGNVVTQTAWKPEWLIQSQSGIWFSLVIVVITFLIVYPHWAQLSLPPSQIKKKPRDVIGLDVFNLGNPDAALKTSKQEAGKE